MPEQTSIEESEYIDFLSLQIDAYQNMQDKAGSIIRYTIAAVAVLVALVSSNVVSFDILQLSADKFVSEVTKKTFLHEETAYVMFSTSSTFYHLLFFSTFTYLVPTYWRIIDVYRQTGISPLVTEADMEFNIVGDSKSKKYKRESILKENNKVLSVQYQNFKEAGFLLAYITLYASIGILLFATIRSSSVIFLLISLIIPLTWFSDTIKSIGFQRPWEYLDILQQKTDEMEDDFDMLPSRTAWIIKFQAEIVVMAYFLALIASLLSIIVSCVLIIAGYPFPDLY